MFGCNVQYWQDVLDGLKEKHANRKYCELAKVANSNDSVHKDDFIIQIGSLSKRLKGAKAEIKNLSSQLTTVQQTVSGQQYILVVVVIFLVLIVLFLVWVNWEAIWKKMKINPTEPEVRELENLNE